MQALGQEKDNAAGGFAVRCWSGADGWGSEHSDAAVWKGAAGHSGCIRLSLSHLVQQRDGTGTSQRPLEPGLPGELEFPGFPWLRMVLAQIFVPCEIRVAGCLQLSCFPL